MEFVDIKKNYTEEDIKKVSEIIKSGGVGVLPTDTVYGITADMKNISAIERIYQIKNRPKNNPMNILISNKKMIEDVAEKISRLEKSVIRDFFPGALTIILKKQKNVSDEITAGLNTIGIRMPDNEFLLKLIEYIRKTNCCNEL